MISDTFGDGTIENVFIIISEFFSLTLEIKRFTKHDPLSSLNMYAIKNSTNENFILSYFRKVFYFIINKFSDNNHPENSNEFMCISKRIL
jgi:hypothetical protein